MGKSIRKPTRGFVRHGAVAQWVRERIAKGKYSPGDRLPAHVDLERQFGTTPVTVQRALQQLRREGFIRTRPNAGSYAADHPPHRWRYAMLISEKPVNPGGGPWSRFFQALTQIAEEVNSLGERTIQTYVGIDGHIDNEDYQRLLADIAAHRLAGLVYSFAPHELIGAPILEAPGILRSGRYHMRGRMPGVTAEWMEPMVTALRWIKENGRRDVSVITLPQVPLDDIQKQIDDSGLHCLPFWVQSVDAHQTQWVRHAVYCILHSASRAPDALLVTDDHLVEAVADALMEFGVRVPDDILVVGHWNFPLKFNRDVPVQLIGLDNVDLLRRWIMAIDAQRRGEVLPVESYLRPVLSGQGPFCDPSDIQRLPAPEMIAAPHAGLSGPF